MAENPLLPNRRLQELHALMLHCRDLDKKHRLFSGVSREAVLAATAVQLEPGDLLCGVEGDRSVRELAAQSNRTKSGRRSQRTNSTKPVALVPAGLELPYSAGVAHAFKRDHTKKAVVILSSANTLLTGWRETLTFAQETTLPLILVCLDSVSETKGSGKQGSFKLKEVTGLSKRNYLPVLTVDGDDAVAMYRAIQEALLRARMQDGPSVVWCSLGIRSKSRKSTSIAHMEQYLASRNLKPLKA